MSGKIKSDPVKNDPVKNDTVKNDTVKNDTVKNDTVKNDTVKNDTVKSKKGADNKPKNRARGIGWYGLVTFVSICIVLVMLTWVENFAEKPEDLPGYYRDTSALQSTRQPDATPLTPTATPLLPTPAYFNENPDG